MYAPGEMVPLMVEFTLVPADVPFVELPNNEIVGPVGSARAIPANAKTNTVRRKMEKAVRRLGTWLFLSCMSCIV